MVYKKNLYKSAVILIVLSFILMASSAAFGAQVNSHDTSYTPTNNTTSPGIYGASSLNEQQNFNSLQYSFNSQLSHLKPVLSTFSKLSSATPVKAPGSSFAVTFTESNLPSGSTWNLYIYSSMTASIPDYPLYSFLLHESVGLVFSQSSSASTITANLDAGTYYYYAGPQGTFLGAYKLVVTGSSSVNIVFPVFYQSTISESGLASGQTWNALGGGVLQSGVNVEFFDTSTSSSTSVSLPSGTFFFDYGTGATIIEGHGFVISNSGISLNVKMPSFTSVTFQETGAAPGVPWELFIYGSTNSGNYALYIEITKASALTAMLPQGSYYYTASSQGIAGNVTNPKLCVGSSSFTVNIQFLPLYTVTFTESGLKPGLSWNVEVYSSTHTEISTSNSSLTSTISMNLPSGSFIYQAGVDGSYFETGTFNVTVAGASVGVSFPAVYQVTVDEHNLFNGLEMFFSVFSASYQSLYLNFTTGTSLSFYLPNGVYNYTFYEEMFSGFLFSSQGSEITVTSQSESFTVSGSSQNIQVSFPNLYKVTFNVQGLESGQVWALYSYSVGATNGFSEFYENGSVSLSSITGYFANGTYSYDLTIGGTSIHLLPSAFNISGKPYSVTITVPHLYDVSIITHDLPTCVSWTLFANTANYSVIYSNSTESATALAYLPNGTYDYTFSLSIGASLSGSFTVNGGPTSVTIKVPASYLVSFVEVGLPAGTMWSVILNNSFNSSSTSTIQFYEFNGTYSYSAYAANYVSNISSGTVVVMGKTVTVPLSFISSSHTYFVLFIETGLANGISWSVNLNGSTSTSMGLISFQVPNGTYSYNVEPVPGYVSNVTSGTVVVNGAQVDVYVSFTSVSKVVWGITFNETGLPSGYMWNISVEKLSNGTIVFNGTSTSSPSFTFLEPNGTYQFSVNASGYIASPASGNVTINGANQYVNVQFTQTKSSSNYTVTFKESGLPSGSSWSVTLAGKTKSTTSSSLSFTEPNGTYQYTISGPANFTASPSTGSIMVDGAPVSQSINFSAVVKTVYFTGTLSPSNASLYINGQLIPTVNGVFNTTLNVGQYYVIEITAPGYKTQYDNMTVSSTATSITPLTVSLQKNVQKKSTPSAFPLMDLLIGVVVVIVVIIALLAVLRRGRSTPPPPK